MIYLITTVSIIVSITVYTAIAGLSYRFFNWVSGSDDDGEMIPVAVLWPVFIPLLIILMPLSYVFKLISKT